MSELTLNLPITGMSCANCAANITRSVGKLDGVTNANANFAAETAIISFDPDKIGSKDIIHTIHDLGFKVPLSPKRNASHRHELRQLRGKH